MSFKEQIKDYFDFGKGERKGILILIAIIILVIIINQNVHIFFQNNEEDLALLESELEEFLQFQEQSTTLYSMYEGDSLNTDGSEKLFHFNPNIVSREELMKLGISEKQANTVKNYLKSGGRFRYKSDFKKIYGISERQFQMLYPYIELPEKDNIYFDNNSISFTKNDNENKVELFSFDPNTISNEEWIKLGFTEKQTESIRKYIIKGGTFKKKEDLKKMYVVSNEKYEELVAYINIPADSEIYGNFEKSNQKIDINSFTVDEFSELGGEWKYLSTRIVNFRKILGGFYRKEQLKEVYGLRSDFYESVEKNIIADESNIIKININFAESKEISKHPYLSFEDAKKITTFRNKNGSYKFVNELLEKSIISTETFNRVSPYLKVK